MGARCFLFLMFVFSATNHFPITSSSGDRQSELWCVAKNNAENNPLQMALDWVCGQGGANCGPIQVGGPCYDSADITRTASYAFNDYFLKHGLTEDSCNFDNTAALTSLNPSHGKCKIPSSSSVGNINNNGSSTRGFISPGSTGSSSSSSSSADLNVNGGGSNNNDRSSHPWVLFVHLLALISLY